MKFHPLQPPAILLVVQLLILAGCAGVPDNALRIAAQSDQKRELQTRHFDGVKETTLLAATAGVLQDLGFNLDESESKLGVVTASRKFTSRRPLNGGEIAKDLAWGLLWLPLGVATTAVDAAKGVKEPQLVRVSLVTQSDHTPAATGSSVRVTAHRIVYSDERQTKIKSVAPLDDALFYQEFFTRLGRSVFLEEQKT